MNMVRSAYALIFLHTLIVALHAVAHVRLGINGAPWPMAFIIIVIWVGPVAAALALAGSPRVGFAVLAGSMIGAWVFGVSYHYVLPGTDNVAELHHAAGAAAFSASAFALAVVEAVGALVATAGYVTQTRYTPGRPLRRRSLPS